MKQSQVIFLGVTEYKSVWDLQKKISALRRRQLLTDILLLTEHKHVYTLGKNSDKDHLLADPEELKSSGTDVCYTDRGGDITYHGPGQIVGYPILDLNDHYLDAHRYLREIEEVLINTLKDYGICARREENFTGVWVGDEKIAAIGVKISRWITMHGFALNVNTDLSHFDRIIPCGIFHKGVTSMERMIGNAVSVPDVMESVSSHFGGVFGIQMNVADKDGFLSKIDQLTHDDVECLN